MDWMKFFKREQKNTASIAKERLMIAVAHQRGSNSALTYLPKMREELLAVVRKYVQVSDDAMQISVSRDEGMEVLELNITLPEKTAS